MQATVQAIIPGSFEPEQHFYERVLNAQIHPLVRYFMTLGNERIVQRYCHLHPESNMEAVRRLLRTTPKHFRWGGADLFLVSRDDGTRQIVVVETNSCPSGQKSMPLLDESQEHGGYRTLLEHAFLDLLNTRGLPSGALAVLYDKNTMEASGYAATLADLTSEPVYLVPFYTNQNGVTAKFDDEGVLHVCDESGRWIPVRAAMRYVTQRPWTRLPPINRTMVFNPSLACLAGGRNKLVAAKAYDLLNAKLAEDGLEIRTPETIWDCSLMEVPLWIQRLGGFGVVKNPYSNAGQGVWTITSPDELAAFMDLEHRYDRFIVQALIGNSGWSSSGKQGRLYHVGTVPNRKHEIFAADVRCMVGAGPSGFRPIAVYARRARMPLGDSPTSTGSSWDVLGTNLSFKRSDGSWGGNTERLLLMDSRDFNRLGIGLDDLIEGYIQTVMSVTAIDEMAEQLVTKKGKFRRRLFLSLNPDPTLVDEVMQ
ncbi:MAG: hypothetical protein R3A47_03525 [Polyangiales bacterium]